MNGPRFCIALDLNSGILADLSFSGGARLNGTQSNSRREKDPDVDVGRVASFRCAANPFRARDVFCADAVYSRLHILCNDCVRIAGGSTSASVIDSGCGARQKLRCVANTFEFISGVKFFV